MNKTCKTCGGNETSKSFPIKSRSICSDCRRREIEIDIQNSLNNKITPSKICSRCKIEKDYLSFYIQLNLPLGRASSCKDCINNKHSEVKLTITEKLCNGCDLIKPSDMFRKSKSKDGLDNRCKQCRCEYDSLRKAEAKNKEKCCKSCHLVKLNDLFPSQRFSNCTDCHKIKINDMIEKSLALGIVPSKYCKKCNQEKPYLSFSVAIQLKLGRSSICKDCDKLRYSGEIKITEKHCKECNCVKNSKDFYARKSKDGLASKCKECEKAYKKTPDVKKRSNAKLKIKRKTDIHFKIKQNICRRINYALKSQGVKKCLSTEELLGATIDDCWIHLESLFLPEMNKENHSIDGWHIDHIIPCDSFDLTKESEQLKCFDYTNLMPRWATTAIAKAHGSGQIGNIEKNNLVLSEDLIFLI